MAGRPLPGGRGFRKGEDRRVGQAESEGARLLEVPEEDLWFISTVGEAIYSHTDVTGVLLTQDELRLWLLPDRTKTVTPAQVRLSVATSAASSYIEVALFRYAKGEFVRLPGTYARFESTATGTQTVDLRGTYAISPKTRLFLGIVAHGGSPAIEGFQGGTASALRLIRPREKLSYTGTFNDVYSLATLSQPSSNVDAPLVVYLSKEASLVL